METDKNEILLRGRVAALPKLSHLSHGEEFFQFPLEVERLSGNLDLLNIQLPRRLLDCGLLAVGREVEVTGSVRTFNNRTGVGSRLVLTVLAAEIRPNETGVHANELTLVGTICRRDGVRKTPLGREICDFTLAVNRRYGRSDYLPCIAWGSLARSCGELGVGDTVHMTGRLQSRKYRKLEAGRETERTAYEVSVMSLEPTD